MRRGALLAAAALVLVAGCGGDEGGQDGGSTTTEAPTTTEAETTTTTAAPDPFSVPEDPADIDEAYVEAVLTELERINGDALRLAVSEGLSPRIAALIHAIYTPERANIELEGFAIDAAQGFPNVRPDPGNVVVEINDLLAAQPTCIAATATLDFAAVVETATGPLTVRVELRPVAARTNENPTAWVYAMRDGLSETQPEPCSSAS